MTWEKVTEDGKTRRMRVPLGWVVKVWAQSSISHIGNSSVSCAVSCCFVPDPLHFWKVRVTK